MLEALFQRNLGIALLVWCAIYAADYALTLRGAARAEAIKEQVVLEKGIELNPRFEADIASRRKLSPRFVTSLIIGVAMISTAWVLNRQLAFGVVFGMLCLAELPVLNNHLLRIAQDTAILGGETRGTLRQSHWLSLKIMAVESFLYAGLFLVLYLFRNSPILLGGALGCLNLGAKLDSWSRRHKPGTPGTSNSVEGGAVRD